MYWALLQPNTKIKGDLNRMSIWKDSLLIGVPEIDEQHQNLVGAIDRLMYACEKGQGAAVIGDILSFAVSYTLEHFAAEEKAQEDFGYPGLADHKQIHADFVANVSTFVDDFKRNGPSDKIVETLQAALVDWVVNHISVEDKKVGDYIVAKGG